MTIQHFNKVNFSTFVNLGIIFSLGFHSHFSHFSHSSDYLPFEICDNALDDDADGLIDLNDPDCECEVVEPVSLIPNPSFEEMNCCPEMQSQLNCAAVWIQASEPTTDFIHMCDWMGWPEFTTPLPFPDGEGIMGFRDGRVLQQNGSPEYNWKEYAGACLLSPLLKDVPYVFEFYVGFSTRLQSPDINITFFGSPDCAYLPFGVNDEEFGCPTNGPNWVRLGSSFVPVGAGKKWVRTTIEVAPEEDIYAIAIGPDCPPVLNSVSTYYFFDNLTLVDLATYQFRITEQSHPCASDFTLQVTAQTGFQYQWYKNGIALVGETEAKLSKIYGEGQYQVRVIRDGACTLTGIYTYSKPVLSNEVSYTMCAEDVYEFGGQVLTQPGQYIDTFKSIDNCDSIVTLTLDQLGAIADSTSGKIFNGEVLEIGQYRLATAGDHLLHLTSSQGCDSLVLLQLSIYEIYIPNIFSPNGDGINDVLELRGRKDEVISSHFIIYDRWGNQVFEGPSWDGSSKQKLISGGVYAYLVKVKMDDGKDRFFTGNVTLLQ